jgi:hypothetical protein
MGTTKGKFGKGLRSVLPISLATNNYEHAQESSLSSSSSYFFLPAFLVHTNCLIHVVLQMPDRKKVDVHYRGADKSLAQPTSRCILFDGENISFDASLVIYIVLIFLQL